MSKSKTYKIALMPQSNAPAVSWLEIAAQAKKDPDPKKLIQLIKILCEALEQVRADRIRDYLRHNSIVA